MENTHFFAMMIELVLFVGAVIFKKMFIDLSALGYTIILAYIAVINSWEVLFYPVLIVAAMILIIMVWNHALKGDLF